MLADREDALDATQEAMIAIARGITRFDGRSAFTTWMYRIATNAAIDEARRKQRRPRPIDDTAIDDMALADEPAAVGVSHAALDERVGARVDVDTALTTLPEGFRVAVVLRDLCDLDYDEIAAVLEIPPGTVRSRISRGRALLRAALTDGNGPDENGPDGNRQMASGRRSDDG